MKAKTAKNSEKPMKLSRNAVKLVEELAKIVDSRRLDSIEFQGIKVTKSRHILPDVFSSKGRPGEKIPDGMTAEEYDLYYSSSPNGVNMPTPS